jgi:hypothetical protein
MPTATTPGSGDPGRVPAMGCVAGVTVGHANSNEAGSVSAREVHAAKTSAPQDFGLPASLRPQRVSVLSERCLLTT